MSDFVLKLRAYAVAATLFDEQEKVEEFANLYLTLLKREREEFDDRCFDEEQLTLFMKRFAQEEPEIHKRMRAAFKHTEKRRMAAIKAEQEQMIYFLYYMNMNRENKLK